MLYNIKNNTFNILKQGELKMSNFGYLLSISQYKSFAQLCIDAENAITRPPYRVCITECRVALEKCVKFIYTKEMNLTLLDYSNMSLWDMIDICNFRKIKRYCFWTSKAYARNIRW